MRIILLSFSILVGISLTSETAAQVNSQNSGDWNNTNTWDCGCVPDFNNGVITIVGSTSVTIPNTYTADADQIVVAGDGVLTIESGGTLIVRDGAGTDLTIEEADFITTFSDGLLTVQSGGLLENMGAVSSNSSNLIINNGGEYRHNRNGGAIPTASYQSGSTVRVTGVVGTAISGGLGQNFHHFIWECASMTATGGFLSGNITSIGGDFTINNTNNQFLILGYTSSSTGSTTVSGNLSINGTSKFYISAVGTYTLNVNGNFSAASVPTGSNNFPLLGTATGTVILNVAQNASFSSARTSRLIAATGSFTLNNTGTLTMTNASLEMTLGSGNSVINSTGAFSVSNGTIDMSGGTGTGTINATSNFSMTSSTITETSTGNGTINFVGTGTHIFSRTGGSILNDINFANASASTLDLGTSILEGTGAFTNNGTLRVGSTHASGALQATTVFDSDCGNIIVSGTRTYANPSIISYNGSAAQFIGDGHPTTAGVDITIANSNGVSIIAPTTLAGTINLTSGNLNIGVSSLTITGNITGPNFITIGSTGRLTLGGSSNIGTFPFSAGAQSFANFTLNNTNGITFANDVTLSGALTLTNGSLIYNSRTLTLNGTLSASAGTLSGNTSSTLSIGGSGAFGTLPTAPGNSIGTLIFNRSSGTASINSSLIVTSAFNLLNGDFTNTNGLQLANGATLTRSSNAQLLGNAPTNLSAGQFYNVTYTGGAQTTGLELPITTNNDLGALTINASGQVALSQPIIVNGNLTLQSSTFSAGSNQITMRGSTWSRAGGNFDPGTGEVRFDGTTTITTSAGNPRFGNLRVESSRTLTLPATTIQVSGNITMLAGATINNSSGTILLDGAGAQSIGAGGATLANITVSKASGSVSLTNALNITGILNITTATSFASTGNLTLLSTSDGTTGNASIASLAAGGSVTGDVIVQRFMSGEGRVWRYLSSPTTNASVASWKDDFPITGSFTDPSTAGEWPPFTPPLNSTTVSMYRYNETVAGALDLGWEAFPTSGLASANPIEVGRGYSAFVRITPSSTVIDVTGPINSGNISLPVSLTGGASADNGWNLVGNPYPSTVDWDDASWTKTGIAGTIYIRDNPSGVFQTWNGSMGSLGSGRIAMGQAFWVQATSAPTLTIREAAKTSTTGTFYKQSKVVPDAFEITLSKGSQKDFAYLWFKDDATAEIDSDYDAIKFNNDIFDFSILTSGGKKLAINTLPYLNCGDELKMDISTANPLYDIKGTYNIEFGELGTIDPSIKLRLIDNFTSSSVEIIDGATYAFDVTADANSFGSDRFKLILLAGTTSFSVESTTGGTSCKPGSVTLTADGAPVGGRYKWYESDVATTPLFESTSSEFSTPVIQKSQSYFVSVANDLGCESSREAVVAEVVNFDDVTVTESESTLSSSYTTGNQWFKDDVLIPGANGQEFKPEESGLYKVEVTIGSCKTSATRSFTVTGLEDDAFFRDFVRIYPNPVSKELTINIGHEISGTPRIINLNGGELGLFKMNNQDDGLIGVFDFEGKSAGIYLLQIADKKGKVFNKRIVKK